MSLDKDHQTRAFKSYSGVGSRRRAAAGRTLNVIGIDASATGILSGTAGNGAAGAALDISLFEDQDVIVSTAGTTYFRINAAPTAAIWHFDAVAGVPIVLHVPPAAAATGTVTIAGWGIGAAHAFNIVRCDDPA